MRLYLVQHGQAKSEDVDPQRRLTDKGAAEVEKVAKFLRPLRPKPAAIWHSGKPRAQQTAEILARALSPRQGVKRRNDLGPKDRAGPLRKAIARSRDDLMIVGHLPFLAKLAGSLLAGSASAEVVGFQYGGVVCLDRAQEGDWTIAWMIVPELLTAWSEATMSRR